MVNDPKKRFSNAVTGFLFTAFLFFTSCSFGVDVPEKLKQHVHRLTHTSKPRNYKNPAALEEASNYIRLSLDSIGYSTRKQEYLADSIRYHNIVLHYGDTSLPRLVIGAHYDVCMDLPGADDNGSGVAGLIELARMLKEEKPELKHCIEMVFYSLEEPPFFRTDKMGSYIHAKDLSDRHVNVAGMVSMEMIGYFSDEPKSQHYPVKMMRLIYPDRGDFIAVVGKKGMREMAKKFKKGIIQHSEMKAEMLIAPESLKGIDFSDHLNYWLFGFHAIMITDSAFMRNKNYHKRTDTEETLDYNRMAEVVKGIFHTLKEYY